MASSSRGETNAAPAIAAGNPPAFAAPALPELTRQQKTFTLVGVLLGMLLAALDQTIVATAGPAIQRDLKIEPSLYTWITTAYLVTSTMMVPIYGKLSDLYGRKPILLTGIGIFLLGSVLCGISGNAEGIIISRAIQGLGSAALFTSAFAVISDIFPPAVRGRYTGIFGAVFGLSSVVGPLAGGWLTDNLSWHWVFFVNLPLGAIALAFIVSRMPLLRLSQSKPTIDFAGAFFLIVFTVPLLLALSLGKTSLSPGETGFLWSSWQILGMFALAAAGLVAFILRERVAKDPIIDLKLFENRTFAVGNLAAFVIGAGFLAAIVFLPLFMVVVVGLSATNSGLTIMPLTFGLIFGNVVSGQLVTRMGRYKPLMIAGLVILMAAFVIMGFTLTPTSTQGEVTLKMILMGLGLGPSIPLYTLAIQNAVSPMKIGVATSAATFFRQMGSTIGVAVLGSFFANTLSHQIKTDVCAIPELPAQFSSRCTDGASTSQSNSAQISFDATKIKADIAKGIDDQKALFTAAIQQNDLEALKKLATNDQIPAEQRKSLEAAVAAGGFQNYLKNQFAEQKDLITKALRDNDPAAIQAVLANPQTPEQLRQTLQAGGIAASVKKGFEAQYQTIAAAINSGNPAALKALLANPQLPAPLKASLSSIPAQALQSPQARTQILGGIKQGLDAAQSGAIQQATQAALAGVTKGLDGAQASASAGVLETALKGLDEAKAKILPVIDQVGFAFKQAFTTAITQVYKIGILIGLLGLLITLLLPELPLRKTNSFAPPAE